jgi:hypothetical protein
MLTKHIRERQKRLFAFILSDNFIFFSPPSLKCFIFLDSKHRPGRMQGTRDGSKELASHSIQMDAALRRTSYFNDRWGLGKGPQVVFNKAPRSVCVCTLYY